MEKYAGLVKLALTNDEKNIMEAFRLSPKKYSRLSDAKKLYLRKAYFNNRINRRNQLIGSIGGALMGALGGIHAAGPDGPRYAVAISAPIGAGLGYLGSRLFERYPNKKQGESLVER